MVYFEGNQIKVRERQLLLVFFDLLSVFLAGVIGLYIACNFNYISDFYYIFFEKFLVFAGLTLLVQFVFGSYRSLWRYASVDELLRLTLATMVNIAILYQLIGLLSLYMPKSFYFAYGICLLMFTGGIRFTYRIGRRLKLLTGFSRGYQPRVLIVGAGKAGLMVLKELLENPTVNKKPVGFIDDDPVKRNMKVMGVKVVGDVASLPMVLEDQKIDEVVLAMPSASKQRISEVAKLCVGSGCKVRMLPSIGEIIDGKVSMQKIRDVDIKDLLGRDEIQVDLFEISNYLRGQTVIVTGGGGSIGSELCRQIAKFEPEKMIILDNYENNAYDIQLELQRKYPAMKLETIIASVREDFRVNAIFDRYRPDVVFHAAAHKHVPLMETSPEEAIKNNVFGTLNVVRAAHTYKAKRFVLISTDKAVNPTNIMGATKRVAEMIIQAYDKQSSTDFVAVRFGNVLGSNGSVIPVFKKQIERGGPVTVTDPKIIRYFMTIPEAVQLVIQAGAMASGGEIFVLDMGEPVKILNLAENLIKLSGFEPYKDIEIEFTGLRPGEKLYEELLMDSEGLRTTKNKRIFIGQPGAHSIEDIENTLQVLFEAAQSHNREQIKAVVRILVPEYKEPIH